MSIDTAATGKSTQHDADEEFFELVDHEATAEEVEKAAAAPKPTAFVVVDNLDDGDTTRFSVRRKAKIRRVINIAYTNLGLTRQEGDRLVDAETQEDVFAHEHETVEDYLARPGATPTLHWLYSGPTGGASR